VRVVVQHIFTEGIPDRTARAATLWRALEAYLSLFAQDGIELRQHFLTESTSQVYNRYYEHKNEEHILEALQRIEYQGADAAVVACAADPAVHEARSILRMPVVGAGESAIALAQFLGKRFAIVVVRPEVVPMVERRLDYLHCYGRAIHRPVRPLQHWSYDNLIDAFEDRNRLLLQEFDAVARECIADGADVIVSGCAYVGPLLTVKGLTRIPDTGVPVVDCTAAAIHMAIAMARLQATIPSLQPSRAPHSPYSSPEGPMLVGATESQGSGGPSVEGCWDREGDNRSRAEGGSRWPGA